MPADQSAPQTEDRSARVAPSAPTPLGIYERNRAPKVTGIEIVAVALSLVWLLGAVIFFVVLKPSGLGTGNGTDEGLRFLMTLLAVFMPVAMIWVAATAARASKVMRDESSRLQTAIDALRHAYVSQGQGGAAATSVTRKLDEIAAAQRKAEAAMAMFSSTREIGAHRTAMATAPAPAAPASPSDDQPALALGTPAEALEPELSNEDFICALNFPETADDRDGFAALRRALKHRATAQLVQAAQDVLTLLSQDGIYMDDLRPDMAKPDVWRRFAEGARGRAIAGLGGVRDRSSLALSAGRMKQDPIFRDAAHHFLRVYDRTFQSFSERASDAEVAAFSNTRTSRAFMLLGRIAGTFD
ncbi:hypothetical protein Q4577_17040 [Marinovum sp. 2_MG-2023]|uniref:hypothetical protein n=1 Tax=unclassified Marinovum TaxID=2647166 RepID=UPI0026E38A25|nr:MULTISPECIES: hypothetical protein [unclassified Marinovum]MDO6731741.1 hypothetical protein [Marinovum sp. 2_MG-2023]MDO6780993.1 hypothetical protein [Marinovum sp. 1_MG-2023]